MIGDEKRFCTANLNKRRENERNFFFFNIDYCN